jgi:hypothetical protein
MKLYAPFIIVMLTISVHAMENKAALIAHWNTRMQELAAEHQKVEEKILELAKLREQLYYRYRDAQTKLEACKESETDNKIQTTPSSPAPATPETSPPSSAISVITPIAPTERGLLAKMLWAKTFW